MLLKQFFIEKIAHNSYLIGGNKTCAIIDPCRDVECYLTAAEKEDLQITHIIETHLHADFVSGHLELADITGAKIYAPKAGGCMFEHIPLKDDFEFYIENMKFRTLETPGHTPDCMVYTVSDLSRGEEPVLVFTGDTLFVNDVGRPDILPGRAKELAEKLYYSLHEKVMALPDSCIVLPAHGAGSLCGKAMGSMKFSTIGFEKKHNPALLIKDIDEFITYITTEIPPAPDHFSRCSNINKKGPKLVKKLPKPVSLDAAQFKKKMDEGTSVVLSIRDYSTFGGQHIPGSYHIDINGNFSTFAGWIIPPDEDILLVTDNPAQALKAVTMLQRVGLDKTYGYLKGGTHAWVTAGFKTDHIYQLSPAEVYEKITKEDFILLDVRSADEFKKEHVNGAINIIAMDLRTDYKKLNPDKPVIAMCGTGHRSSLACAILKQKGFKYIYNAAGGITGYKNGGFMNK